MKKRNQNSAGVGKKAMVVEGSIETPQMIRRSSLLFKKEKRNDLCSCKSGKKYKNCCIWKNKKSIW